MSDELDKKINQISELLGGQENLADNLKSLLTLLASNNANKNDANINNTDSSKSASSEEKESSIPLSNDNMSKKKESDETSEMANRIAKVINSMNSSNDPRINLLLSLKPFLNTKRQNKLNTCIKMLNISKLTRLLDENDKGIL